MPNADLRSRRPAGTLRAITLGGMALLAACSSTPTEKNADGPPVSVGRLSPAVVSAPTPMSDPDPAAGPDSAGSGGLAYVSLRPGTDSAGIAAVISGGRGSRQVEVALTGGGFDPVGIPAAPGDTLQIQIRHASGSDPTGYAVVPKYSVLTVVRTSPPQRKTDVPLNARVEVIFSEPIVSTTLAGAIHLRHGGLEVPGKVGPWPFGETALGALFSPSQPLAVATAYELEVSTGVTSLTGNGLAAPVFVTFTTGGGGTVVLSVDPTTDEQQGVVGARLAKPIRVIAVASSGPRAGVIVNWRTTSGGRVEPASSVTDSTGSATAEWVLDTLSRYETVVAQIQGRADTSVIHASGLPGPPADIRVLDGDRLVAVNQGGFHVFLYVYDQYGNFCSGQYQNLAAAVPVAWSVIQGHLRRGDSSKSPIALFAPDGVEGPATISASALGKSVRFAITVGPPERFVVLEETDRAYNLRSGANGSRPAVDTILAGTTLTWTVQSYHYALPHLIRSVGSPSFSSVSTFHIRGWGDGWAATRRFMTPGVYHYTDLYDATWESLAGTLVVR